MKKHNYRVMKIIYVWADVYASTKDEACRQFNDLPDVDKLTATEIASVILPNKRRDG